MPRKVTGGLIQCATPVTDASLPVERIKEDAIARHIPFIEEAGKKGVQILGLQEIFDGPYFCPSQDPHWYDMQEFLEKNAHRGWTKLEDFRGIRRERIVSHSKIKRPDEAHYHGGYDTEEPAAAERSTK